jgi:hypothetical protein
MRCIAELLWLAVDGEINTREEAAQILDEEAPQYAEALKITTEAARRKLKTEIEAASHYYAQAEADRLRELYEERAG